MKEDLISIIIPVHNSAKYIKETIESIEKQTYPHYEAIFVDDCSTDESVQIIERYQKKNEKLKIIKLKRHRGVAIARNIGTKKAKGKYLAFLDSDDVFVENKLKWQKDFMEKNNYEFVYGSFRYRKDEGNKISDPIKVQKQVNYEQALLDMRILPTTVMIDLQKIPKRYCYMPNVMNEDAATWWKILKKGYIAYGQEEVLAYYRKAKKSRSSQKIITAKGRWDLYRNLENLSIRKSMNCFIHYAINATRKRMVRWNKMDRYTKNDLQVLIATQNLKEDEEVKKLLQNMNVKSKYLMINQSEESKITDPCVITKNEKGLSKSRNQAIQFSDSEILLFADDDVRYKQDYVDTMIKYHNQFEDADMICFYVESKNKKRRTKRMKTGKIGYLKAMRIVTFEISVKKSSIEKYKLSFHEGFGAGTKYNRGEEQILLYDALRKGLKVLFVNKKIGEAEQENSTWFSEFDAEFFEIQGRVFKEMTSKYYKLLIFQYAIRKYFMYSKNLTLVKAIKSMIKGSNYDK